MLLSVFQIGLHIALLLIYYCFMISLIKKAKDHLELENLFGKFRL
jgi:hypothetical protein